MKRHHFILGKSSNRLGSLLGTTAIFLVTMIGVSFAQDADQPALPKLAPGAAQISASSVPADPKPSPAEAPLPPRSSELHLEGLLPMTEQQRIEKRRDMDRQDDVLAAQLSLIKKQHDLLKEQFEMEKIQFDRVKLKNGDDGSKDGATVMTNKGATAQLPPLPNIANLPIPPADNKAKVVVNDDLSESEGASPNHIIATYPKKKAATIMWHNEMKYVVEGEPYPDQLGLTIDAIQADRIILKDEYGKIAKTILVN